MVELKQEDGRTNTALTVALNLLITEEAAMKAGL
jgi:hypothetical protein